MPGGGRLDYGMALNSILLSLAAASWGAPHVHPVVKVIQSRPALRLAVAQDLLSRNNMPSWTPASHGLEVQKLSLSLVAYRDEIPKEVLIGLVGVDAAGVVAKMSVNAEALQTIKEDVGASDPAVLQRLEARLDEVFDNDFGGGSAATEVLGKESAGRVVLGKSASAQTDFKRRSKDGEVERGTYKGKQAVRLTLPDGSKILAVRTGKAKTWPEARQSAQALGEGFDLPVRAEYMPLKGFLEDVRVSMGRDGENTLYPMWLRTPDELGNGPMRLAPLVWGADEARPGVLNPFNISPQQLAGDLAALDGQLKGEGYHLEPDERDRLLFLRATIANLIDATKDGWPVYAVHVEAKKAKKDVPPPSLN